MNRFEGKIVLVTGAAEGIGRITAIEFARAGATVVVCDRNGELGAVTSAEIVADGSIDSTFIQCDVSSEEQVACLFAEIGKRYGRLDIAVNNVGVEGELAPIHKQKALEFDRVIASNLKSTFLCMREELRIMQDAGSGVIINIASIAAHIAFPNASIYTASKHALLGLTKAAALENADKGIRVCAISPGAVDTDMTNRFTGGDEAIKQSMIAGIPIGRMCQPIEIARGALFLASDDAALMIGQTLHLDGGWANVKP
ncbi:3-oxoacyl-ACP reductase [Pseudomonas chlororaphis]|uniref:3-oxoacyl-ACP reductase n=1 Tax=Pseudomonas chlororaphis TaxID=587753 RepID=A0A3G7TYI8_9PSED|nr:glucose 1-dehydrogenase [Pseudomonas chlororaphis]AZE52167.1 3-oxoacyl-ACP reductase [Pseudomonas chlororaphis]